MWYVVAVAVVVVSVVVAVVLSGSHGNMRNTSEADPPVEAARLRSACLIHAGVWL